jgi:hypothetical protein
MSNVSDMASALPSLVLYAYVRSLDRRAASMICSFVTTLKLKRPVQVFLPALFSTDQAWKSFTANRRNLYTQIVTMNFRRQSGFRTLLSQAPRY